MEKTIQDILEKNNYNYSKFSLVREMMIEYANEKLEEYKKLPDECPNECEHEKFCDQRGQGCKSCYS